MRNGQVVEQEPPALAMGDRLSRAEFLRRWVAMPHLKRAELIRGVVYMPMPVRPEHGDMDYLVAGWLFVYSAATPGCKGTSNATWLMQGEETPQPDTALRILPECGGQSRIEANYLAGAPEFLAEVCLSSAAYDLHQKREVYEEAGVREYLAVLIHEQTVRWHRLSRRKLRPIRRPADGIFRSTAFPGLWLDSEALLRDDKPRLMNVLQQGLAAPEHAAFVKKLAARRKK